MDDLSAAREAYVQALGRALEEIVRQLARLPEVERVILFGSYAAGRRDLFTDLDLLVVMDTDLDFPARTGELHRRLRVGVDVDFFVYTPEEFRRLQGRGLAGEAVRRGTVLYEKRTAG